MKIAIHSHSIAGGGAERSISILAEGLVERGHQVLLVTFEAPSSEDFGIPSMVKRVSIGHELSQIRLLRVAQRVVRLRKTIQDFGADVVLGFMTTSGLYSFIACLHTNVGVICCERANPVGRKSSWFFKLARHVAFSNAAMLACQTEGAALWYKKNIPRANCKVIPNSVRNCVTKADSTSPRLNPAHEDLCVILAVGRLDHDKGIDLLVNAVSMNREHLEQTIVVIVGDGPERQGLQEMVESEGLSEMVQFVGRTDDPSGWYERADIFVHASRSEGFPNVLLEAMSHGCAVVATDCDYGPRDIVANEENGLLVPLDPTSALGEAIVSLVEDEQLRRDYGQQALSVREKYSSEKALDLWEDAIREAII